MRKIALAAAGGLTLLVLVFCAFETFAYLRFRHSVGSTLERCSARTAVVLSHTEFDPATLERSLRSITEAIAYLDGLNADLHVHADGAVHFSDEQAFRYLKLCGDTLRSEKSFSEAALAYLALERQPQSPIFREEAFGDLLRRHGALREKLTELANENGELLLDMRPGEHLVDVGAIEHARREIDFLYGVEQARARTD